MRKVGVVTLVLLLVLAGVWLPSPAMAWGSPGHGFPHFGGRPFHHFDGRPFHHFHHDHFPFFFGLGVGALVTAPLWWYGPTYPYPVYPPVPPSAYWYYCQDPAGYYPYVPQCPGGWLTVVPPAGAP
jgi:hypothetical protein